MDTRSAGPSDPTALPVTYDAATIVLHWLTAILVLLQWGGAISMDLVDQRSLRMGYWTIHIVLGTVLFAVIVLRLAWRQSGGRVLELVGSSYLQAFARIAHRLLYTLILTLIGLGLSIVALRGWTLIGFKIAPLMADYHAFSNKLVELHGWVAHVLIAVAFIHAAAALYHHSILKDGVLQRILGSGEAKAWVGRAAPQIDPSQAARE